MFQFRAISNSTINILVHFFGALCLLSEYLEVELLAHRLGVCSALVETVKYFPKWLYQFAHNLAAVNESSIALLPC